MVNSAKETPLSLALSESFHVCIFWVWTHVLLCVREHVHLEPQG